MAEPILRAAAEADTHADGPLRQDNAQRQRLRGKFEGLIFLAAVAIIGIALVVSVFAASFVLFGPPPRPATPGLVRGMPTSPPAAAGAAAVKQSPSEVTTLPAPAAASAAPPVAGVAPTPATSSAAAARPRAAHPPALTAKPVPAAATFALAQGDANFSAGEVSVARFYYEQALDGGDADAAVRMGKTFDPRFLTPGRLRRVYADSEAARFWYERALALGVAEAKQLLETEPAESEATPAVRSGRYRHRAAATRRYDRHAPATIFQRLLQRILYPNR
jgi:hypothetical protein